LYESARWLHFKLPGKLQEAYRNSDFVVTAWDGQRLVGVGRAVTDGCFSVYFPNILVHPEYRGRGIGRGIISKLIKHYKGFFSITAIAEEHMAENFLRNCGLTDEKKAFRKMGPVT
jgi:GNAT superfamily N-acetyltransferase